MPDPPKKRLLVVVNVFHPDRGGGGAIFSDLCYGLVERGYDVTVRCAYPYYPEWKDKSGKNGFAIERCEDHGVHVERYGLYIPKDPRSLAQRLLASGDSILDRLHQAMLLFGRGHTALLGPFLNESGMSTNERFWKLAQALSALYPKDSDEKRWVDGVLARKKALGM